MDITILFNVFCIITIGYLVAYAIYAIEENVKYNKIYNFEKQFKKEEKKKKIDFRRFKFLQKHRNLIQRRLKEAEKEHLTDFAFYSSLTFTIFATVYIYAMGQWFIALLIPFITLKFFDYLLSTLAKNIIEEIEATLPLAIDNIIRINSKYSDVRTILWEASLTTNGPLSGIFEEMSRKMVARHPQEVLIEFADIYDNVWFYSFSLILISYTEDSNKTDTMKNLKNIRDMLDKENVISAKKLSEGRYGIVVNYSLSVLALIALTANLIFNPYGKEFFFSTVPGLACFFIGIGLIFFTVVLNIKMTRIKK